MLHDLNALVPAHRAIVEAIRGMFAEYDEDELADTIAGESDLPDAIVAVLRAAIEREAQAKAIKDELVATLISRARRLEEGAKKMRGAALEAMQAGGLPKIKSIDMTISVGRGKNRVQITEPDLIPAALCRIIREPNKIEIGKILLEGTNIPGATLGNPIPFLTVHRS